MMRNVLVFAEARDGQLRQVSLEALSAAHMVAEGGEVAAVMFGQDIGAHTATLGQYGASKVYAVTHDMLAHYTADGYAQALMEVIRIVKPEAIIAGHTPIGRIWLPKSRHGWAADSFLM